MDDFHPQGQHQGGGHEATDVKLRGIIIFAIVLVVSTAAIQGVLYFWEQVFERDEDRTFASRPARLRDETGQFPAPRLQGNPGADMARFRVEEDARLDAYGWVDRRSGIARIPIARAMDALARDGLPTREPAKEAP